MIFRKNKEELNNKKKEDDISGATYRTEHALDSRLDGLRFRVLNKSEFEAQKATEPHSIEQISFVRVFENGAFSHFELYKGDILILPNAAPPTPTNKFGKVVRINDDIDRHGRYINTRQVLTLPTGESITGTAVGFTSSKGQGTFLYKDASGRILLGSCSKVPDVSSKLSIVFNRNGSDETLSFKILPMSWGMCYTGAPSRGTSLNTVMISINNSHYYVGNHDGRDYWAGNISGTGTTGALSGYFKDESYGYDLRNVRVGLFLDMPNIHNNNLDPGADQFAVRLGLARIEGGTINTVYLNESDYPYHRLGLTNSLSDGSALSTPRYVDCFIPGKLNYEDFLDIAKIICVPTEVDI